MPSLNAKALEAARNAATELTSDGGVPVPVYVETIITAYLSSLPHAGVNEEMVEAAVEIARLHLEIDGDNDGPFIRFDSIDAAVRAILATRCSSQQEEAVPFGWLYDNEDTGREFSEQHPVDSGEVPDATNIVPANAGNLLNELRTAWVDLADSRQVAASPVPADAGEPTIKALGASWNKEHDALGRMIKLLDEEPSIGDAEMADALEIARCAWDHSKVSALVPATSQTKGSE